MQTLRFGPAPGTVDVLAVEPLSDAPTPAASLEADRERLLAHPLAFRDKVLFSTVTHTYLGFLAGLQPCQGLVTDVPGPTGPVTVVSPLQPVVWDHDGKREPVEVHLLLGLRRAAHAPDTHAESPPPKPAQRRAGPWLWIAATFATMTGISLALGHWWSPWAAIATCVGLISGGVTAGLLQDRYYGRVQPPVPDDPALTGYWETVRALANRQLATSALPGEWTVTAIPAGLAPPRDWSLEIGALVVVVVTGLLLRWPPPGV